MARNCCRWCDKSFVGKTKYQGYCSQECRQQALAHSGLKAIFHAAGLPTEGVSENMELTDEQEEALAEYIRKRAAEQRESWHPNYLARQEGWGRKDYEVEEVRTSADTVFAPPRQP